MLKKYKYESKIRSLYEFVYALNEQCPNQLLALKKIGKGPTNEFLDALQQNFPNLHRLVLSDLLSTFQEVPLVTSIVALAFPKEDIRLNNLKRSEDLVVHKKKRENSEEEFWTEKRVKEFTFKNWSKQNSELAAVFNQSRALEREKKNILRDKIREVTLAYKTQDPKCFAL